MRLIDADVLTNSLDSLCDTVCQYSKAQRSVMCGACPLDGAFDVVDNTPTVDAEPVRHGEWEFVYEDTNEELRFECSLCKGFSTRENFCPHCGADMRGEDDGKTD